MIDMEKRIKESNKEELVDQMNRLISIKEHLAINKILLPVQEDSNGKRVGFFKVHRGVLQVHIRIPKEDNKCSWYWFNVLDATEEEKERNLELNIVEG